MFHSTRLADLYKRLLFSSLSSLIIITLILLSPHPIMRVVLALFVAALASVAVWEYAQLALAKDLSPSRFLMITVSVLLILSIFVSTQWLQWPLLPILVLFLSLVSFFLAHFKTPRQALVHTALHFFGVCYIVLPLGLLMAVLFHHSSTNASFDGRIWLFYLIFVTKITDIGGYFVGRLWGKHRLAPILSPNKTVEGSIAGFLSAILLSLIFYFSADSLSLSGFSLSLGQSLWLGACIGIFSQIGDLAESLLKRDALVKDSNAFPGVGGVLDMVDSLLLTAPVVFFFIQATQP